MSYDIDKFQKPNFDARLAYISVLKNYLNTIALAQIDNKYTELIVTLRAFFIFTSPYNKKVRESQELLAEIKKLFKIIKDNSSEANTEFFDNKLDEFQIQLMNNIKYILMPLRGDEEDDWDDFAKQSDIQINKEG